MKNIKIIRKKIKNIHIRVKKNLEVILSVPTNTTNLQIKEILKQKEAWIQKHLDNFKKTYIEKTNLNECDKIYFLGKTYNLKLKNGKNNVILNQDEIWLFVKDINCFAQKEKVLNEWYKTMAKELFEKIIIEFLPLINKKVNAIRVKKMTTRWGSCNSQKGYINLNLELIKKDIKLIEYVIFHELTHLIHPNHGKGFYNFLSTHIKDYKSKEKMLRY